MNQALSETSDYHSSSGMSEVDSLSDSDWLDIASGHESEDNDSISSQESDRDPVSIPHSRRSSVSMGSSRESDVEAWEGFVYDSGDESAPPACGMYPVPLAAAGVAEPLSLGLIPDMEPENDLAEDKRVREALDQSLIGTLSASRSSTTGGNGSSSHSIRDLRLSFPDPLTSSRDELNRSYEDVSPPETTFDSANIYNPTATIPSDLSTDLSSLPTTPEVVPREFQFERNAKADFEIHLYGSSPQFKWSFVQAFMQKVAEGSGRTLLSTLDSGRGDVQTIGLEKHQDSKALFSIITVYDRTEDSSVEDQFDFRDVFPPSLGIIFLPSTRLPTLSSHTAYLPVFLDNDSLDDDLNDNVLRNAAEDDWDLLCVPPVKVLNLREESKSGFIGSDEIQSLNSVTIYQTLESTITGATLKKHSPKSLSEHPISANAVTLFALVSIIMGFAFNTTFRSSPTPTPTINLNPTNNNWGSFTSGPNRSNSLIMQGTQSKVHVVTSSLKDMTVSLYEPGTTSLSLTSQTKSLTPSSVRPSKPSTCKECNSSILPEKPKVKEEGILPSIPPTSLAEIVSDSPFTKVPIDIVPRTEGFEDRPITTTTALSLKFVDSLSEVLGVTTKALTKVVNNDAGELMDNLDELMNVIRTQTDEIIKQSKGKARAIGEQVQALSETVQSRNDRARHRAKELKKMGGELILSASEQVKDRTAVARQRARRIKQTFVDSEAWQVYQKAHRDWSARLREKDMRNGHCTRSKRRNRKDGRLRTSSFSCA